jgi:hypothetical protein
METLCIHIKCSNKKAYKELEKLCQKYRNSMFIDGEQSYSSYVYEQGWVKQREADDYR